MASERFSLTLLGSTAGSHNNELRGRNGAPKFQAALGVLRRPASSSRVSLADVDQEGTPELPPPALTQLQPQRQRAQQPGGELGSAGPSHIGHDHPARAMLGVSGVAGLNMETRSAIATICRLGRLCALKLWLRRITPYSDDLPERRGSFWVGFVAQV